MKVMRLPNRYILSLTDEELKEYFKNHNKEVYYDKLFVCKVPPAISIDKEKLCYTKQNQDIS